MTLGEEIDKVFRREVKSLPAYAKAQVASGSGIAPPVDEMNQLLMGLGRRARSVRFTCSPSASTRGKTRNTKLPSIASIRTERNWPLGQGFAVRASYHASAPRQQPTGDNDRKERRRRPSARGLLGARRLYVNHWKSGGPGLRRVRLRRLRSPIYEQMSPRSGSRSLMIQRDLITSAEAWRRKR